MSVCDKLLWEKINGAHWIPLFADWNTAVDLNFFGIEYVPQGLLNKIKKISYSQHI